MPAKHPEIIAELIKAQADKLRPFSLSSFFSDKPLKEVFQKIDRTMQFFSVYVFMERLEEDLWEDDRYTYFFTYDSHNHFMFKRKEDSLWLYSFHLIGNFQIDREESEGILRDVSGIEGVGILRS